jgi:hypothetical protein
MLTKELPLFATAPAPGSVRSLTAVFLRATSRTLESLALRLAFVEARAPAEPVLEFHGEAGAPEGALYIDGQLVGHVLGVNRL